MQQHGSENQPEYLWHRAVSLRQHGFLESQMVGHPVMTYKLLLDPDVAIYVSCEN